MEASLLALAIIGNQVVETVKKYKLLGVSIVLLGTILNGTHM